MKLTNEEIKFIDKYMNKYQIERGRNQANILAHFLLEYKEQK